MALGTFTLTGTYTTLGGAPAGGQVRIDIKSPTGNRIIDSDGDVEFVGPKTIRLDNAGKFSLTLPTDVTTGESAAIGYRVVASPTQSGTLAPVEFWAKPSGSTWDVADIDTQVVVPLTPTALSTTDAAATYLRIDAAAPVATTGAYADLSGQPAIPSTAADVGADPAGAASTAETNAKTYADQQDAAEVTRADAAYAKKGQPRRTQMLEDEIRRGKLGKIGTGGKGAIALRFDHQLDNLRSKMLPLLQPRRLPFTVVVVTGSVGQPTGGPTGYEPTNTTWAQLQSDVLNWGGELFAHSRTHGNPVPPATLYDEIVGSKLDIEQNLPKCRVMGFSQPGGPSTYYTPHVDAAGMDDEAGNLIRNNFGLFMTQITGTAYRGLPTDGCRGFNHVSVDDLTLADAKAVVDRVIDMQLGVEIVTHPDYIGGAAPHMSIADYTAFLDYIVSKRDAGTLEVLTSSALAFADPGSSYRPSLIPNGDFVGLTTATPPAAYLTPGAAWTIQTDGGHSGSNYLRIPSGSVAVTARRPALDMGIDGHAVMFEGWVRSLDATPPSLRIWVRGMSSVVDGTNDTGRDFYAGGVTSTWQRVRHVCVVPKGYRNLDITYGKASGTGTIDWDDVRCVPI